MSKSNKLHVESSPNMNSFFFHSLFRYLGAQANQRWIAAAQSLSGKMHIISPKIPSLRIMEIVNAFYELQGYAF